MEAPGFDFLSGAGFIRADSAVNRIASSTANLIRLVVPDNVTPGLAPFDVTVKGNFLSPETEILFRGTPVTTTILNDSTAVASIPAFTGNPAITAYTAPITPSGKDGGLSNAITFFDIVKKHIVITADNKTKLYGEAIPTFTSTIKVDGVASTNTQQTLTDLGLGTIRYRTPATSTSNVNRYIIQPSLVKLDPANPDPGLLELYTVDSVAGVLTVAKMPLVI
jgi:hypothetical protein